MPRTNLSQAVQAATQATDATPQALNPACSAGHDQPFMLQCTQSLIDAQAADPQFWTEYDYFLLEREARAMRRAWLSGLVSGALRRVREHFASRPVAPARR